MKEILRQDDPNEVARVLNNRHVSRMNEIVLKAEIGADRAALFA